MFYSWQKKAARNPLILSVLLTCTAALSVVVWDYIENPLNLVDFQSQINNRCIRIGAKTDQEFNTASWHQLRALPPVPCVTQGIPDQPASVVLITPWSDDAFASIDSALVGKGFLKLPPSQKNPALWGGSGYFIDSTKALPPKTLPHD
ncbi:MAG: hypothetical protein K2X01_10350 [Cyanobacteria bacterium]|nr:hypothetical protein [Cyanobacteriota bacterium]